MAYKCLHCSRTFATPAALKRHISVKHQYDDTNESREAATQSNMIQNEEPGLWDEDFIVDYSEVNYYLIIIIIVIMKINLVFNKD